MSIMVKILDKANKVDCYKEQLTHFGEVETEEQKRTDDLLHNPEKAIHTLNEFHSEVAKHQSAESQHVLGHIAYSPPISASISPKCFTEDWALIKLDNEKIDRKTFKGNMIKLDMFQSISPRSSSLTTISRHQFEHFAIPLYGQDVP